MSPQRRRFEPLWLVAAFFAIVVVVAGVMLVAEISARGDREGEADSSILTDSEPVAMPPAPGTTTPPTPAPPETTVPPATSTTSTTTTGSSTSTSTTTSTIPMPETRLLATSPLGHPIYAVGTGDPDGVPVLAVGNIHGNEPGGLRVVDLIRQLEVPAGVRLWLIDTVNPDGLAAGTRTNSRGVDLNRNADSGTWQSVGAGTSRYSGPAPASELETQGVQAFIDSVQPVVAVWYHQAANWVDDNTSVARYDLLLRYADLVGMDVVETSCVTACVGTISSYVNRTVPGASAWVVELPSDVSGELAALHAAAFMRIADEAVSPIGE